MPEQNNASTKEVRLINGGYVRRVKLYTDDYLGKINVKAYGDINVEVKPRTIRIGTVTVKDEDDKHIELCVDERPKINDINLPDPIDGVYDIVILPETTARLMSRAMGDMIPSHMALAFPEPSGAKRNDRSIRYLNLCIVSAGFPLLEVLDENSLSLDGQITSAIRKVEHVDEADRLATVMS